MHIPITRYGLPQVLIFPALITALMAALFIVLPQGIGLVAAEAALFIVLVWMLMFFRDPPRKIPLDERVLLSPADGTVTDISEVDSPGLEPSAEAENTGSPPAGKALRIGLFLSIFSVHINRMPCSVRVESVRYKKGLFKNAMSGESGRVNESNEVLMSRLVAPADRLLVRQVSGAIARRIVCEAKPEQEYAQGAAFGMIKFGSRTELYLPLHDGKYDIAVKIGDKVNAGLSPLIVYKL